MTTSTISPHSNGAVVRHPLVRRPIAEVVIEKLARRILAWSEARAEVELATRPDHDRMALIRENEAMRVWAGSAFGR